MKALTLDPYQQQTVDVLHEKLNTIAENIRRDFKEYRMLAVSDACDALTDKERRKLKDRMRRIEWGILYRRDAFRRAGTQRFNAYNGIQTNIMSAVSQ